MGKARAVTVTALIVAAGKGGGRRIFLTRRNDDAYVADRGVAEEGFDGPAQDGLAAKLAELLGDAGAEALALAGSNDQRAYGHGARLARRQPLL